MKRRNPYSRERNSKSLGSYRKRVIYAPRLESLEQRQFMAVDVILEWNDVLLEANANDYTLVAPEQGGPISTSQAFATVSAAMYDAYNSVERIGDQLEFTAKRGRGADVEAAVAQAAHDTLVALYPSQKPLFDASLQTTLDRIQDGTSETEGRRIGAEVAFAILRSRANSGANSLSDPDYEAKEAAGFHNVDPLHPEQGFYASGAADIKGFVVKSTEAFSAPLLDDGTAEGRAAFLQSEEYTRAYNEVMALGGDGVTTPTERTEEQTQIGQFWAYDGRPEIGTPPRLYNQVVRTIAEQEGTSEAENARLFALVNIAMADAGVAAWETKYQDDFWRPVLGVRGGEVDGNENTTGDENWTPLGAPASNPSSGETNFTPNFPSYVSGHATFGAAAFEMLENFFGTDQISFSVTSDELNGETVDASGVTRPLVERSFDTLTDAKLENAQSRIYLGIHWSFDAQAGIAIGDSVADYVYANSMNTKEGSSSNPWNKQNQKQRHNRFDPEDENDVGEVGPEDALMAINSLRRRNDSQPSTGLADVNHDGDLSPTDALQVINRMNRQSSDRISVSNKPSQTTNVFFFKAEISGTVYEDLNGNGTQDRREKAMSQVEVELLDDAGEVIDQTQTDRQGRYRFTEVPETGDFHVRVATPTGMVATSDEVLDVHIVSGDVMAGRQDFGLRSSTATTLADATRLSQTTGPMLLSASSPSIGSSSIAQNTNERGTRVSAPKGNEQTIQSPVAQNPAAQSLPSENNASSQSADFEDIAKLRSQQRRIASIDSAFARLYD